MFAFLVFDKEKGDFQLVFSDIVLPDLHGVQLVDKLLSQKPELKILLCSGYTNEKSQWPLICEKGFPFLQKPYNMSKLLVTIKDILEKNT